MGVSTHCATGHANAIGALWVHPLAMYSVGVLLVRDGGFPVGRLRSVYGFIYDGGYGCLGDIKGRSSYLLNPGLTELVVWFRVCLG